MDDDRSNPEVATGRGRNPGDHPSPLSGKRNKPWTKTTTRNALTGSLLMPYPKMREAVTLSGVRPSTLGISTSRDHNPRHRRCPARDHPQRFIDPSGPCYQCISSSGIAGESSRNCVRKPNQSRNRVVGGVHAHAARTDFVERILLNMTGHPRSFASRSNVRLPLSRLTLQS